MAVARKFKFKLGQEVRMTASGEGGEVIGRADYQHTENHYLVRYVAGDGRAVEAWWSESAMGVRGGM